MGRHRHNSSDSDDSDGRSGRRSSKSHRSDRDSHKSKRSKRDRSRSRSPSASSSSKRESGPASSSSQTTVPSGPTPAERIALEAKAAQDAIEEKMRLRQEKLAAWRQSQTAATATTTATVPGPEQTASQPQAETTETTAAQEHATTETMDVTEGSKAIEAGSPQREGDDTIDHHDDETQATSTIGSRSRPKAEFSWEDGDGDDDDEEPVEPIPSEINLLSRPKPMRPKVEEEEEEFPALKKAQAQVATTTTASTTEPAEEVDPLEAFMQGVSAEVTRLNRVDKRKIGKSGDGGDSDDEDSSNKVKKVQDPNSSKYWHGYKPKERKELEVPNHKTIEYAPFRSNFYTEVPEIAKMTDEDVTKLRFDLENIKVTGKNVPKPVKKWSQVGLSPLVMEVLKHNGFEGPTPIQAQALPVIMSGRDFLGIAKTGSGKTLAFLLPLLRHVADQPRVEMNEGPIAIILTPTRELALQIYNDTKKFTKVLNLRSVCVYGGTNITEQIAELRRGAEIAVCTPGRMIDMLTANNGKVTNLRRTTICVLDEADRMFDMGFEPQVMRILDNVRPDRQTVMFSATFPRQMEALARRILKKPVEVQVGGRSVVSNTVDQHVLVIDEDQKFVKLLELLGNYQTAGSTLIFVHKQGAADVLQQELMKRQYISHTLHGGLDQVDRDSNLFDFKQGTVSILIATSVAARGLDVRAINLVVNYDCPNHYEDYVHRCGRTGRAGRSGTAFTFITPEQGNYSGDIIRALELSGAKVPDELAVFVKKAKEERKQLGIEKTTGGFGGHGLEKNAQKKAQERSKALKASGLQEEIDEGADEPEAERGDGEEEDEGVKREKELNNDIDSQLDRLMGKALKNPPTIGPRMQVFSMPGTTPAAPIELTPAMDAAQKRAAEIAKKLQSKVNAAASAGPAQPPTAMESATQNALQAVMQGKALGAISKAAEAAARVAAINQRFGITEADAKAAQAHDGGRQPQEASSVDQRCEQEMEINDFPQSARWKVTRRETVADLSDYADVAITIRGTYYAPNTPVPEGERKLYLVLEGKNQSDVQKAIGEIRRMLREELIADATSYNPAQRLLNPGKYKVLAIGY